MTPKSKELEIIRSWFFYTFSIYMIKQSKGSHGGAYNEKIKSESEKSVGPLRKVG
jgi:hypothetical protein